jgi:hypothetical protein
MGREEMMALHETAERAVRLLKQVTKMDGWT